MSRMDKIVKENIVNTLGCTEEIKDMFLNFVETNSGNYFSRENTIGHITSSMFVLNPNEDKVLLTLHKKFGRWLQLGGHNDTPGQAPLGTAVKEMFEEGFGDKKIPYNLVLQHPLDIDVHNAGDHLHYDICFVCMVDKDAVVECSFESDDVDWKTFSEILENTDGKYGERLKRMVNKVVQMKELKNDTSRVAKKIS